MSHVPLHLALISLLLHSSALTNVSHTLRISLPLSSPPSLSPSLPPCINTLRGSEGRGRTISQSLSRFKVPFLPPLLSLLHCSTCCCLIKLFPSLPYPHSRSFSLFLPPLSVLPPSSLPHSKCLVGHRPSFWFLLANEPISALHTHTHTHTSTHMKTFSHMHIHASMYGPLPAAHVNTVFTFNNSIYL